MRAALLAALAIAGCATIVIPNTPEAQACNRDCMFLANQCVASGISGWACLGQKRDCWRSCPGAYEEGSSPRRRHKKAKTHLVCEDENDEDTCRWE